MHANATSVDTIRPQQVGRERRMTAMAADDVRRFSPASEHQRSFSAPPVVSISTVSDVMVIKFGVITVILPYL